jgi:predicted peptidase
MSATEKNSAAPEAWEQKFASFTFHTLEREGRVLPYRLHRPAQLYPGIKYPLVLFFHGAGERGADNRGQLLRFASTTPFWEKYPCFVLAPQCPAPAGADAGECVWVQTNFSASSHTMKQTSPWPLRLARELLERTLAENPVDLDRIYITGLSMGAFATWDLLQRDGGKFAAAMPVCGGADLSFAPKLSKIPVWLFHGDADPTVPVCRSRDMIAALKAAGGSPRYTEYPGVGHDAWGPAFSTAEAWDWLFSHRR